MTLFSSKISSPVSYSDLTLKRADRALRCSAFTLLLFIAMRSEGVPLPTIAGLAGIKKAFTQTSLSERRVEGELMWLIQVGLLRREVDGQGITDSFRLTPLGRQLITQWKTNDGTILSASWWERIANFLTRWLRLPF